MLYDRVARDSWLLPRHHQNVDSRAVIALAAGAVPSAVVMCIDNVLNHVIESGRGLASRHEVVRPPFDLCFVEATLPAGSAWEIKEGRVCASRLGVLVLVEPMDDVRPVGSVGRTFRRVGEFLDAPRWLMRCIGFAEWDERTVFGPFAQSGAMIEEDGTFALDRQGKPELIIEAVGEPYRSLEAGQWAKFQDFVGSVVPFAFALCHSRNVVLVENDGRHPSRQARREAERRGDAPPTKFYTLQVEPIRGIPSVAEKTGSKLSKALHICRGHFSHYTEEKPLFGKYAGQFWIPAHVRGTADAGIVAKDYAVKAPRDEAA